jgi:hypothetical protein
MKFNDGAEGYVDLADERHGEMFAPLNDKERFKAFRVGPELETTVWDNSADFAPEFLHGRLFVTAQSRFPGDAQ